MQRRNVDKRKAAKDFRGDGAKTKSINLAAAPMRGGWRL